MVSIKINPRKKIVPFVVSTMVSLAIFSPFYKAHSHPPADSSFTAISSVQSNSDKIGMAKKVMKLIYSDAYKFSKKDIILSKLANSELSALLSVIFPENNLPHNNTVIINVVSLSNLAHDANGLIAHGDNLDAKKISISQLKQALLRLDIYISDNYNFFIQNFFIKEINSTEFSVYLYGSCPSIDELVKIGKEKGFLK